MSIQVGIYAAKYLHGSLYTIYRLIRINADSTLTHMNNHLLRPFSFLAACVFFISCTSDPCKDLLGKEKRNCEHMRTVLQTDELLMKNNGKERPPDAIANYLKSKSSDPESFESYSYKAIYKGDGSYTVHVHWSANNSYGRRVEKLSEFRISESGNVTAYRTY